MEAGIGICPICALKPRWIQEIENIETLNDCKGLKIAQSFGNCDYDLFQFIPSQDVGKRNYLLHVLIPYQFVKVQRQAEKNK